MSGLAWYFFSRIFDNNNVLRGQGLNWFIFFVLEALSYALLFVVALAKDRYDFWLTTLISSLWILVFMGVSATTIISAAALFIASQIVMEFPKALEHSLNIHYFSTAYMKIALVILALIGISAVYLQTSVNQTIQQPEAAQKTSDFFWPYISKYVTQFDSTESVDDYIRDQFKEQGVNNVNQYLVDQERKQISEQVGFEVKGNEEMSDVGKKLVAYRLNDFAKEFKFNKTGVYVIFVSLLVLWPIGRIFFGFIAVLIYWLLKRMEVIKVVEGQVITKKLEL